MKKKILTVSAITLCFVAVIISSIHIFASDPMDEKQLNNVEALNSDNFDIRCKGSVGLCKVRCVTCGSVFENTTGGSSVHVESICPNCGEDTFELLF